jgi:hypothetical protein
MRKGCAGGLLHHEMALHPTIDPTEYISEPLEGLQRLTRSMPKKIIAQTRLTNEASA